MAGGLTVATVVDSGPQHAAGRAGGTRPGGKRGWLPSGWLWLAVPALVTILFLFGWPVVETLRRSTTDYQAPQEGGLDNFSWFLTNEANLRILLRTMVAGIAVTVGCLVIAYPFAYLMSTARPLWRSVLMGTVLLQFCSSPMAQTFAWVIVLQDTGPLDRFGQWSGIGSIQLLGTTLGAAVGMIQAMLPYMILPLYAVMSGIDHGLVKAARSLGARPAVAFANIYIPLSLPGILAGCLMVFVISLGFYLTPAVLGSPNQMLLSQFLVNQINILLAWGRGGAVAAVMVVTTALILVLGQRFVRPAMSAGGAARKES